MLLREVIDVGTGDVMYKMIATVVQEEVVSYWLRWDQSVDSDSGGDAS